MAVNGAGIFQLIKSRSETVTDTIVRRVTAGMKAGDVSQTSVLNDLFLPISRRRAKELGIGEEEESRYVGRLSQEISRNDALDKIAIGAYLHESPRLNINLLYAYIQAALNIIPTCASTMVTLSGT